MNLLELCKRADAERNKPTYEAILLLRSILTWFQNLPEQFDEAVLQQKLPQAVENEDDIIDCSFSKKGYAKVEIFNYEISKEVKLSPRELSMFKSFAKLVSANIYSISQYLDSKRPMEIFFYFKKEDENKFWRFYHTVQKVLPDIEIDFDYNENFKEEGEYLSCMYVSFKDLVVE